MSLRWEDGEGTAWNVKSLVWGNLRLRFSVDKPRGATEVVTVCMLLEPGERSQSQPNTGDIANHGTGGGFLGHN